MRSGLDLMASSGVIVAALQESAMLKPLIAAALAATLALPALPAVAAAPTAEQLFERSCANVLNLLPRIVRKSQVAAIPDDATITLHPICFGVPMSDSGNASGLGRAIAANTALSRELRRWGFSPDDVIALAINGNSVQVYVHRDYAGQEINRY